MENSNITSPEISQQLIDSAVPKERTHFQVLSGELMISLNYTRQLHDKVDTLIGEGPRSVPTAAPNTPPAAPGHTLTNIQDRVYELNNLLEGLAERLRPL